MWVYVAFFVIIALAVLTIVIRIVIRTTVYYDHVPDLHGKTFVITGKAHELILIDKPKPWSPAAGRVCSTASLPAPLILSGRICGSGAGSKTEHESRRYHDRAKNPRYASLE